MGEFRLPLEIRPWTRNQFNRRARWLRSMRAMTFIGSMRERSARASHLSRKSASPEGRAARLEVLEIFYQRITVDRFEIMPEQFQRS